MCYSRALEQLSNTMSFNFIFFFYPVFPKPHRVSHTFCSNSRWYQQFPRWYFEYEVGKQPKDNKWIYNACVMQMCLQGQTEAALRGER